MRGKRIGDPSSRGRSWGQLPTKGYHGRRLKGGGWGQLGRPITVKTISQTTARHSGEVVEVRCKFCKRKTEKRKRTRRTGAV